MKNTQQNPCFHAEGDVFTHTLMVLENVLALDDSWNLSEEERVILYWAAILHDIGKPETTKWEAGRYHSHGHEVAGVPIARNILLQQEGVSDSQRQKILDLVRWHSIPLKYGLRKKSIQSYLQMAINVDIRLLGIFAFCDLTGRICKNKEEVYSLIMHFNRAIVPDIIQQFGTHVDLQRKYRTASLSKKNQLWKASKNSDGLLLEQLILSQDEEDDTTDPKPQCIIPIGVQSTAMHHYLDARFPDAIRVKVAPKDKAYLNNAVFTRVSQETCLLLDGDFTQIDLRDELVKVFRRKGIELRFLFLEEELSKLTTKGKNPVRDSEIRGVYRRLLRPHLWEAHQTEFIRLP